MCVWCGAASPWVVCAWCACVGDVWVKKLGGGDDMPALFGARTSLALSLVFAAHWSPASV